jgi:hypothetical protein
MSQLLGFAEGITILPCVIFAVMAIEDLLHASSKTAAIVLAVMFAIALALGIGIQLYICLKHWW